MGMEGTAPVVTELPLLKASSEGCVSRVPGLPAAMYPSASESALVQSVLPVDPGFVVEADIAQRMVKGEDCAFFHRADASLLGRAMPSSTSEDPSMWRLNYDAFVVCDGHSGVKAYEFVKQEFLSALHPRMPTALPQSFQTNAGANYAAAVRAALTHTFEDLNARFAELGQLAGCTMTVALVTGALMTVANLGDSDAVLDVFSSAVTMTTPHRVNDNVDERERVLRTGAAIAPLSVAMDGPAAPGAPGLGPLRIWPGGLCVSRGIGDIDVGEPVIAKPHIRQVLVPPHGCRLIVATDGLWDCLSTRIVINTARGKPAAQAASSIVTKCLRVKQGELIDDTTVCVIDCRPHHVATFKGYHPERQASGNGSVHGGLTGRGNLSSRGGDRSKRGSQGASMTAPAATDAAMGPRSSAYLPEPISDAATMPSGVSTKALPGKPVRERTRGRGAGFACCLSGSAVADDDDDRPSHADTDALRRVADVEAMIESQRLGSDAPAPGATSGSGSGTGGDEGSGSGMRRSGSVVSNLSRMVTRRKGQLAAVELFADIDMAYEPLPLATVSESTAGDGEGSGGEPAIGPGGVPPAGGPRVAEGGVDSGARAALSMDMFPTQAAEAGRAPVLFHTMGPSSKDDITTRPRSALGPINVALPPLPESKSVEC